VIFLARKKGERYKCDECGLVVIVEDPCGCEDTCGLICCGEPMNPVEAGKTEASEKPEK